MKFDVSGKRLYKMIDDVFAVMNKVKAAMDNPTLFIRLHFPLITFQKTEITDYGKIQMYDISNTKENGGLADFLEMYRKNKSAYLQLTSNK